MHSETSWAIQISPRNSLAVLHHRRFWGQQSFLPLENWHKLTIPQVSRAGSSARRNGDVISASVLVLLRRNLSAASLGHRQPSPSQYRRLIPGLLAKLQFSFGLREVESWSWVERWSRLWFEEIEEWEQRLDWMTVMTLGSTGSTGSWARCSTLESVQNCSSNTPLSMMTLWKSLIGFSLVFYFDLILPS